MLLCRSEVGVDAAKQEMMATRLGFSRLAENSFRSGAPGLVLHAPVRT